MSELAKFYERLSVDGEGVTVRPPSVLPSFGLFDDVLDLYRWCGGIDFYVDAPYPMSVVTPSEYRRANDVILGEDHPNDRSHHWFVIARYGSQFLSVDTAGDRCGRVYDSFVDCHAVAGSSPVVASSIAELLLGLLKSRGQYPYWLADDFIPIADAYD